jgi:hypothetical protein
MNKKFYLRIEGGEDRMKFSKDDIVEFEESIFDEVRE